MEIVASAIVLEKNGGKIEIHHDGGKVTFNFSTFKRDSFDKNEVFLHINRFWAEKPPAFQKRVFDIYAKMSDLFFQINDKKYLTKLLEDAFVELYDLHPIEEMRNWLVYKSGVTFPEMSEGFVADTDRDYTPEKTYIRSEYIDMLNTGFMLRAAIPIWSYYIRVIKDHAGTGLKEHRAFELLKKTKLFNSPAVRKMQAYVQANIKKQVVRSGAIGILSPEDNPFWVTTQFCVRKLAPVELQFRAPNATIVSLLYSFVKTNNSEGSYEERYKDKNPREGSSAEDNDGGNKVSVYERHRNSTDRSIEEAAEFQTALKGVEHSRSVLCPTLPVELLERSIKTSMPLLDIENMVLTSMPCQKTILGWILSPILSVEGIPYQEPDTLVRHQAFAEAILWYRGFHFLSLLMTSRIPVDNDIHHVTSTPFRSRLSDDNLKTIRELFPHVRVVQNRKSDPREECFIVNDIDALSSEISEYTWLTTADDSMVQYVQRSTSRRLNIIPDIRNELARLCISITNKSFYHP